MQRQLPYSSSSSSASVGTPPVLLSVVYAHRCMRTGERAVVCVPIVPGVRVLGRLSRITCSWSWLDAGPRQCGDTTSQGLCGLPNPNVARIQVVGCKLQVQLSVMWADQCTEGTYPGVHICPLRCACVPMCGLPMHARSCIYVPPGHCAYLSVSVYAYPGCALHFDACTGL